MNDNESDPKCANCGHKKAEHYHKRYTHSRGPGDVCHATAWIRGRLRECGCNEFVERIDGKTWN